jgi:hypothetical protein
VIGGELSTIDALITFLLPHVHRKPGTSKQTVLYSSLTVHYAPSFHEQENTSASWQYHRILLVAKLAKFQLVMAGCFACVPQGDVYMVEKCVALVVLNSIHEPVGVLKTPSFWLALFTGFIVFHAAEDSIADGSTHVYI